MTVEPGEADGRPLRGLARVLAAAAMELVGGAAILVAVVLVQRPPRVAPGRVAGRPSVTRGGTSSSLTLGAGAA
jgi:hypothetical protein